MINKDFFATLELLEKEKKINKDLFISSLEAGLTSAYKKEFGESKSIEVKLNAAKNEIKVFAYRTVVEEVTDPEKEISLEEAKELKAGAKVGTVLQEEITPKHFSRIATQTAIQVVKQRLNDAHKSLVMDEMSEKEGEILNAVVRRVEDDMVFVEMTNSQLEGIMLSNDCVKNEQYKVNEIIKVYVKKVKSTPKGASVLVSRSVPQFVKRLFEMEVPEIKAGVVVIKNIVREAGFRTKLAVYAEDGNIDPIGACIGLKGARINAIVSELNGEKIDIIQYSNDPVDFIARALSPAKVNYVQLNQEDMAARVIVPDDKLSLAIGKDGQNARLAARLTGWKIDVKPYSTIVTEAENSYNEAKKAEEEK
jgi:N utilization substance protein A